MAMIKQELTGSTVCRFYFYYELVTQSVLNNTNTISWKLTGKAGGNGVDGIITTSYCYVKAGSDYLYSGKSNIGIDLYVGEEIVITSGSNTYNASNNITCSMSGYPVIGGNTPTDSSSWRLTAETPKIVPTTAVATVTNFNDEENPVITYKYTNGSSLSKNTSTKSKKVTKLEACISFTGGTDDVPYRDVEIPTNSSQTQTYTFELTEDERITLRKGITSGASKIVRMYLRTTLGDGTVRLNYADATLTLINHKPTLTPIVRDVNPVTLAVTGDEYKVILSRSNCYFETGAAAHKEATIASQLVTNGTEAVKNQANGIIEAIESNIFTFNATDSRGINADTATVEINALPYVPLTCNQTVEMELINEDNTEAVVTISGNYFNGSFGIVENTLKLEIRRSMDNARGLSEWVDITPLVPDISDNKYTLTFNVSNLKGGIAYDFQCRATDKLGTVETPIYTAILTPIFDWSETDFNFNVPVNINGDLTISGSLTTGDGEGFLLPHILSDTISEGNVELTDNVSNYEYIEVFYTDNNNKSGGYTRFLPPAQGETQELSLALIQAASDSTYIRRTTYKCKDNLIECNNAYTGYCWIKNNSIEHATDKNYLKIVRVVGYR
jgi:hypothetical protein